VGNCKRFRIKNTRLARNEYVLLCINSIIIIFTVDNFVWVRPMRPVEARPNRRAENGVGYWGGGSESPRHQLGVLGEQCKLS